MKQFRKDILGLILGPLALFLWLWFGPRGTLTLEAHRLAGILWLTIIWWVTEPIPIPATGLISVALVVILGATPLPATGSASPAKIVFAPFADPSVFFLLGGMFIGRSMQRHGLDRRIALSILCRPWASRSPATLTMGIGASVAFVSMWISNTAATAMVFPVTMGMLSVLAAGAGDRGPDVLSSPFASSLLIITAYASSVGGVATPIGTATNVVAMGFFRQPAYFGQSIDFVRWCQVGVPLTLILLGGLFVLLKPRGAVDFDLDSLRAYLRSQRESLGPWNAGERNTMIVFAIVLSLWMTPSVLQFASTKASEAFTHRLPEEVVALLAPVLLFLLPLDRGFRRHTLELEDFSRVDWGSTLLFGSGLSLGSLMFQTGLAEAIGRFCFEVMGTKDVWSITGLAIVAGVILSEFTSNAATAATLIPVVWGLCKTAGVERPEIPLFGVTFAASFGSALPVSTPPNAMVYSSGLIPIQRMIRAGVAFDAWCVVVIWIVLRGAVAWGWTPVAPTG